MGTIATGLQTRQKDCYAYSDRVQLALRTNSEELNSIVTPQQSLVRAGIDAPTVAATGSVGGGGSLSGYYVYSYVYSSTKYPYVSNDVSTADGELWPRSNPAPMSSVQNASAGSKTITLTLTKTTQEGIDKILVYRTQSSSTSAGAQALADAGTLYYIATVNNNGIAGTAAYSDTGVTDTGEVLELDNYPSETTEFCVFDGTYWWAAGNAEYTAEVTLDGTAVVTVTDGDNLFDGRDGQFVTFDGISTGGFDGVGTWYAKITASDTVTLYQDADLTSTLVVAYTGTTTMHIRALNGILYRSKPFNPFSWGFTETIVAADQSVTSVPQSYALNLGGGRVSALAVSPNGKRLIVHFDNPQRTIALDLEFADSTQFGATQQILDNTGSVTAHFTLFNGYVGESPMLLGMDTYNGNILASDGYRQQILSDSLGAFLLELDRTDRAPKFFHGQYDPGTELNCFWARLYDTPERNNVMIWMHAATGQWGWMPDFDVLCSATCLDGETNERLVIGGTELGLMGQLLDPAVFDNWLYNISNNQWAIASAHPTLQSITLTPSFSSETGITKTSPSTGVFRSGSPKWVVGQSIWLTDPAQALTSAQTVSIASIVQIDDDTWETTLTGAYTDTGGTMYAVWTPEMLDRVWNLATSAGYTAQTNIKLTYSSTSTSTVTYAVDYNVGIGSTTLATGGAGTSLIGGICFLGTSPSAIRFYFDLSTPTIDKRRSEVWTTASVDEDDSPMLARFYNQFSESSTGSTVELSQDTIAGDAEGSPTGLAWFNRNQVPSSLLKEYGVELMQFGGNDATFYNFTIKVNEAG